MLAVASAAALYRASGLVHWHVATFRCDAMTLLAFGDKADNQTGFDVALGQSVVISAARTWRMPSLRPRSHLTLRADRHGRPAIQENPSAAPSHYRILGFIAGILLAFASEYL